ncbi:MAG: PQQ-binding-like beta-propeller repeat protein [Anaerolineae bacterium]|nr:PQQ-binding-like beta-propeller repeat protein [Anaerolineae bacterium]
MEEKRMSGIPPNVNNRLRTTLLRCGPFFSDSELTSVFVDARIEPWRNQIPSAATALGRVQTLIDVLYDQYTDTHENALALFLYVLSEHKHPGDSCYKELVRLADSIRRLGSDGESNQASLFDIPTKPEEISLVKSWSYYVSEGVASVAVSANGQCVLAGSLGKQALCLDQNGQFLWSFDLDNQAWRVQISDDGKFAAIGTGNMRPWDRKGLGLFVLNNEGKLIWQHKLRASVWGLSQSANGNTIAVGTDGNEMLLFDGDGYLLWKKKMEGLGWSGWVWDTALSADGQIIALGSANKSLQILNRSGSLLTEYCAQDSIFAVAVSHDGQTIAAGSRDHNVYLLDRQGRLLWQEELKDKIWSLALSADGQQVIVGAGENEGHVRAFHRNGNSLWKRAVKGEITAVEISALGQITAVGTRAGYIYIFQESGSLIHQYKAQGSIRDVAISVDGRVVIAGSEDGYLWGMLLSTSMSNQ